MSEKIINRIKKMLALANDLAATEAERDTALNMAYKTMAHHNLSMATIEGAGAPEPREGYDFEGFSFPFAKDICQSVAKLFFCYYIVGEKKNGTQCKHIFVGKESNAATAMVMADFIIKSVMKEGRKLYKQNTSPECRSFCVGASHRLSSRIFKMMQEATSAKESEYSGGSGLILLSMYEQEQASNEDRALTLFDIKTTKRRASNVKMGAYGAGQAYGDKINLSLQVGNGAGKTERLA